ncbi:hypothetical protein DN581_25700 [Burkholderia multivorans]|uniref:DUF7716 domain-containing protein n=1 Tax=Burkholderia multivorans TaxID=87883 RepID=UPI000DAE73E6|nr:hypothetical protein [Burkholderia multivorans]RAE07001.1 hypothetical protein DN581_25700 [Burkholderia multivorans]HEM8493985.1 hypothetical protein [Burkholderia multivorans]
MSTITATEVSLKQVFEHPGDFTGWLYLPPTPWTFDTEGGFVEDAKDDAVSIAATRPGWQITLNSTTIEEIVINAHDQVDEPSIAQLFDAFVFYLENDEFILL